MKNEPSNKEYSLLARCDLHRYREMGFEYELVHYRFLDDETDTCLLLDYDFNGPDVTCTIMGPNGRENVDILSLYIKKEYVPSMKINPPDTAPSWAKPWTAVPKPNLTSIDNPIYWIWWTIGATILVGALNLI